MPCTQKQCSTFKIQNGKCKFKQQTGMSLLLTSVLAFIVPHIRCFYLLKCQTKGTSSAQLSARVRLKLLDYVFQYTENRLKDQSLLSPRREQRSRTTKCGRLLLLVFLLGVWQHRSLSTSSSFSFLFQLSLRLISSSTLSCPRREIPSTAKSFASSLLM